MSQSSIPLKILVLAAALAGASAATACGFDGRAKLETTTSGTEPPASSDKPSSPDGSAPPPADASDVDGGSGEAGQPVLTCSDPALSFDGVDDGASVPDDPALDIRDDFTVEAWIKPGPKATTAEMAIVSHHDASASRGWLLRVRSGRVEVIIYGSDWLGSMSYTAGDTGPAYIVPGKWVHIAAVADGDALRIFHDGVLRDEQSLGTFFGRDAYSGPLRLGRASVVTDFPYEGDLDDVRISNVARYTGNTAPKPTAALPIDASTVAAWRFDEASGNVLIDAAKHNHDATIVAGSTAATRVPATCIASR